MIRGLLIVLALLVAFSLWRLVGGGHVSLAIGHHAAAQTCQAAWDAWDGCGNPWR